MYQYLDYLPMYLREIREFCALGDAANPPAKQSYDYTMQKYKNQYIQSADSPTLSRWEALFKLTGEGLPIEERRLRILAKMQEHLPFTIRALREMLQNLCGERFLEAKEYPESYRLEVEVLDGEPDLRGIVRDLLGRVVPANIIWAAYCRLDTSLPEKNVCLGGEMWSHSSTTMPQILRQHSFSTVIGVGVQWISFSRTAMPRILQGRSFYTNLNIAGALCQLTISGLPSLKGD